MGSGGTKETSIRSYNFFLDTTVQAAGTYAANEHVFIDTETGINFVSHTIQIANDGANHLYFSFNGVDDHGRLFPANQQGATITQDFRRVKKIWFRGTTGDAFRFWAW